jgi:uncharacterized protein
MAPIPLTVIQPTSSGCGSCSSGGGCGSGGPGLETLNRVSPLPETKLQTDVSFQKRRLNLTATPDIGTYVTNIDLDLTVECNLRCTYCFKEKWNEHMEERTALDTMIWLLYASGPVQQVGVNFMGGEPLLRFRLIKRLVPFGKRRAWQMGKSIHFGMTTNGTLVTDEVVAFWKKWGMGFHTSIDGTPDIQDQNRPTTGGRGSSHLVAKAVPKILSVRPNTTARSTVVPDTANSLVKSYRYFRSLGYVNIAFVPGGPSLWCEKSNAVYKEQFEALADILIDEFRKGELIILKGIDEAVKGIVRGKRPRHACGAGRGLLLVDIHGDIWPCHRWNKGNERAWRIGNIYEQFDELVRKELDIPCQTDMLEQDCPNCVANHFCGGGCPAENLEETGKVYKRHNNACEHTRVWARAGQRVHDTLVDEKNETFLKQYYPDATPA